MSLPQKGKLKKRKTKSKIPSKVPRKEKNKKKEITTDFNPDDKNHLREVINLSNYKDHMKITLFK